MRRMIARSNFAFCALIAASVIGAGCGGGPAPRASLFGRSPAQRIPAIKAAVATRDLTRAAKPMVKALSSDDPAERFYAIEGLERLTGETHGYVYYEDEASRKAATLRWEQWLSEKEGAKEQK